MGKSSFINAMRRMHLRKGKMTTFMGQLHITHIHASFFLSYLKEHNAEYFPSNYLNQLNMICSLSPASQEDQLNHLVGLLNN